MWQALVAAKNFDWEEDRDPTSGPAMLGLQYVCYGNILGQS